MKQKIKLIYQPYCVLFLAVVGGYTLLNGIIIHGLDLALSDAVKNNYLPLIISGLIVILFFPIRLKLLKWRKEGGGDPILVLIWLVIGGATVLSQYLLKEYTAGRTVIGTVERFEVNEPTPYYEISGVVKANRHLQLTESFNVSGEHNERYNMHLYAVVPLYPNFKAASSDQPTDIWLGMKEVKTISNRSSFIKKAIEFQNWKPSAAESFKYVKVDTLQHFTWRPYNKAYSHFKKAAKNSDAVFGDSAIIVEPLSTGMQKNQVRLRQWGIGGVFLFFLTGSVILFLVFSFREMNNSMVSLYNQGKITVTKRLREGLKILMPKPAFLITPLLAYIMVIVYLIMALMYGKPGAFTTREVMAWGGIYGPLIRDGEWWRLITCLFVHGGFIHILLNLYGLLLGGFFIETTIGRWRFLGLFLLCGIGAGLTSLWWNDNIVSVGASGAIFGLFGLVIAFSLLDYLNGNKSNAAWRVLGIYAGVNLVMGILSPNTDNAAHVGGLIIGLIVGIVSYWSKKR